MKLLWAPWRIKYIKGISKNKGCFICDYVHGDDDEGNLVLYRTEDSIALMNAYPYTNGHVMVAPKRHVASLTDLSPSELADLFSLVSLMLKALKQALNPHGFNVGINIGRSAGAGLEEHMHVHIVPRWFGDVNFMTTLADTRVINQSLKESYEEIRNAIRTLVE